MYLIIPLSIFLVSFVAIAIIVSRKFYYLKKLNPDLLENGSVSGTNSSGFWSEFFPELFDSIKRIDLSSQKSTYLSLSEKILRRLRIVSLKIDSFTHNLLHKIRTSSASVKAEKIAEDLIQANLDEEEKEEPIIVYSKEEKLRQREQELILKIAQNPKDADLYKRLGNIYVGLRNFSDAAESFRTALKLDPEDSKTIDKLEKVEERLEKTTP